MSNSVKNQSPKSSLKAYFKTLAAIMLLSTKLMATADGEIKNLELLDASGSAVALSSQGSITVDKDGALYIADSEVGHVLKATLSVDGKFMTKIITAGIANIGLYITSDALGNLYFTSAQIERNTHGQDVFSTSILSLKKDVNGNYTPSTIEKVEKDIFRHEEASMYLDSPLFRGLAYDNELNCLFVANNEEGHILQFMKDGERSWIRSILAEGFFSPEGIALDQKGRKLYVVDYGNDSVIKSFDLRSGVVATIAGQGRGTNNGVGTAAQFYFPQNIAFDTITGNLFIPDQYSGSTGVIRKLTLGTNSQWAVSTLKLAGHDTEFYSSEPRLTCDTAGNLYVGPDTTHAPPYTTNGIVRKITFNSSTTALAKLETELKVEEKTIKTDITEVGTRALQGIEKFFGSL